MDKNNPIKTHLQLFFILFMTAAVLVGLSLVVGTGVQPQVAVAQGPLASPSPPVNTFSLETLESYGLSPEEIQAATWPFNLQVTVVANPTTISSGNTATFIVTIKNLGPNSAQYIYFSQSLPPGMTGGTPVFGPGISYISDGRNPATYLLTNVIPINNSVQITVSGTLSSLCNVQATYQARVDPFEGQQSSHIFSANVNVVGAGFCLYLPYVRKDPTPTPLPYAFYDNFSDNRNNWSTDDGSGCNRSIGGGEYEIEAENNGEECFGAAPKAAERKEGTFKVKARRESGSSNFTVAVYANGSGGSTYYALEVDPDDDCDWKLIRLDDGNSDTLDNGDCSAINQNSATNTLELRHIGKDISAYINGVKVGSATDNSDLDGVGTGFYVRTNKDDNVIVRFDDFTVIQP